MIDLENNLQVAQLDVALDYESRGCRFDSCPEGQNKLRMEYIMLYTHGIIAIDVSTGYVIHFVGYFEEPDAQEWLRLYKELKTEDEFGLVDVEFILAPSPDYIMNDINTNRDSYEVIAHKE